jgi:23S rRNA-/tRNA-specific pseudouridylate synthase
VGLPLDGDKKYVSKVMKNSNKNVPHHLLHAHKLEFTYQGEKYSFTSELPKYFEELIG